MRQYNLMAFIITKQHFHKGHRFYAYANIQVFISSGGQSKSIKKFIKVFMEFKLRFASC